MLPESVYDDLVAVHDSIHTYAIICVLLVWKMVRCIGYRTIHISAVLNAFRLLCKVCLAIMRWCLLKSGTCDKSCEDASEPIWDPNISTSAWVHEEHRTATTQLGCRWSLRVAELVRIVYHVNLL